MITKRIHGARLLRSATVITLVGPVGAQAASTGTTVMPSSERKALTVKLRNMACSRASERCESGRTVAGTINTVAVEAPSAQIVRWAADRQ
jgi:hypothetical protein